MAVTTSSPFRGRVHDLTPTEVKVVWDYFDRIRTSMLGHMSGLGIPLEVRQNSLAWLVESGVLHIEITVDNLGPKQTTGYGAVDEPTRDAIVAVHDDLERLLGRVRAFLRRGLGRDLAGRLARLDAEPSSVATLAAAGASRHVLEPGRIPPGARHDRQPPRNVRPGDRRLREGQLGEVLAPEPHRRRRLTARRRHPGHRGAHAPGGWPVAVGDGDDRRAWPT